MVVTVLKTVWARIAAALVAFGALANLLWPPKIWPLPLSAYLTFGTAFAGWIVLEILSSDHPPHPHDISLITRFRTDLPEGDRQFLREQDFGNPFQTNRLSALGNVAHNWQGAGFEFHDTRLDKKFKSLQKQMQDFLDDLGLHTRGHSVMAGHLTLLLGGDDDANVSPQSLANIKRINEGATGLTTTIDDFERLARKRTNS
jgi:hypothetical protein